MDETRYRQTLELIRTECEMILHLKYGTPELELRTKSASLVKIGLFTQNALLPHDTAGSVIGLSTDQINTGNKPE